MMRLTRLAGALSLFALAAVCVQPAASQAPPGPLPPKPAPAGSKQPGGTPEERREAPADATRTKPPIRVQVDLVTTPVTVRDATGELVFDLEQKNFRVYDNGVEQKIEHFDLGGEPLSLVFLFETSSHIEALLPAVRRTGILFTQTVLGQTGEAAVLGANDEVQLLLPFTSNPDQIEKSISTLRMGTSGLRLYDALSQAVGLLRNRPMNRRRVVIAVSEAADTGSENKLGAVLREAQLSNITIYTVGLSTTAAELRAPPKQTGPPAVTPPGTFGLPPIPGTPQTPTTEQQRYGNIDLLALAVWIVQRAANALGENSLALASVATGGLHVSTFRDRSIEQAIDQIGGELHAQYALGYRPTGTDPSGYHEIKVVVSRPGLAVRARPGYYLAPPEG